MRAKIAWHANIGSVFEDRDEDVVELDHYDVETLALELGTRYGYGASLCPWLAETLLNVRNGVYDDNEDYALPVELLIREGGSITQALSISKLEAE